MNLLKGTREENLVRDMGILVSRDFKVNYSIKDKKVAAFVDALRHYFPIYRSVVLDIYELLFLLVRLPEEIQEEKKAIDDKIRALHNRFLIQSIAAIEQGIFHEKELLESLQAEFKALTTESSQLVKKGRESVRD